MRTIKPEIVKGIKKILKGYSGTISSLQRSLCQNKIGQYNIENSTHYWVDFGTIGQSNTYYWLAIREGGQHGKILKKRTVRNEYTKMSLSSQIEAIEKEMEQQTNEEKAQKKRISPVFQQTRLLF